MVKIKYANNPNKLQNEIIELNKIYVNDLNLYEIENNIIGDYTGDFELIGTLVIGENVRNTHIRLKNFKIMNLIITQSAKDVSLKTLFIMDIFIYPWIQKGK